MDDLSDDRLTEIANGVWHRSPGTIEIAEMVAELQRRRKVDRIHAQERLAAKERVLTVVLAGIEEYARRADGAVLGSLGDLACSIARRVTEQLSGTTFNL